MALDMTDWEDEFGLWEETQGVEWNNVDAVEDGSSFGGTRRLTTAAESRKNTDDPFRPPTPPFSPADEAFSDAGFQGAFRPRPDETLIIPPPEQFRSPSPSLSHGGQDTLFDNSPVLADQNTDNGATVPSLPQVPTPESMVAAGIDICITTDEGDESGAVQPRRLGTLPGRSSSKLERSSSASSRSDSDGVEFQPIPLARRRESIVRISKRWRISKVDAAILAFNFEVRQSPLPASSGVDAQV